MPPADAAATCWASATGSCSETTVVPSLAAEGSTSVTVAVQDDTAFADDPADTPFVPAPGVINTATCAPAARSGGDAPGFQAAAAAAGPASATARCSEPPVVPSPAAEGSTSVTVAVQDDTPFADAPADTPFVPAPGVINTATCAPAARSGGNAPGFKAAAASACPA